MDGHAIAHQKANARIWINTNTYTNIFNIGLKSAGKKSNDWSAYIYYFYGIKIFWLKRYCCYYKRELDILISVKFNHNCIVDFKKS